MSIEPLMGRRRQRKDILRAVYEDNLRAGKKPIPPPPPREAPRWRAAAVGLVVLVGALVGLGIYNAGVEEAPPPSAPSEPSFMAPRRPAGLGERLALYAAAGPGETVDTAAASPGSARVPMTQAGLPLASLLGLQVRTIVIDPGHGGEDPGALGQAGTLEKDVTLDVARRLRDHLEQDYGYRILLTRETDTKVSLKDRVTFTNAQGADLFVSIHVNSLPDPDVSPVETYYFGVEGDAAALRSAERENKDSDYSLADFKSIIQEIGDTMKLQESKRLAGSIQSSLIRNMRRVNPNLHNWGVKTAPFVVLLGVDAPAVLAEVAAISHPDDELRLGTEAYRERLAASIAEGVARYLELQQETPSSTQPAFPHAREEE